MTTLFRIGALTSAALFGVSLALSLHWQASGLTFGPFLGQAAHAQANCDWYAKTALKQQQENEQLKCGFKGDPWSTDLKAHAAWCQSVAPEAWKEQAKKRDQDLAACSKK